MSWIKSLLIVNILLLCSFSRTISPVNCNGRWIRSDSNDLPGKKGGCRKFMYECHDKACIPKEKFCDHHKDCADGSDELPNCMNSKMCMDYEFRCDNGFCEFNNKRCDGNKDCHDNSDELNCEMNRCKYNGQLCDQICTDITKTTYQCSCAKEYVLQEDNKTCKIDKGQDDSLMIFARDHSIGQIKLPSKEESVLVTNITWALSVGVDAEYVYWSVERPELPSIYRSRLGTNQPQPIVTTGIGFVEDIAVDWITSNVYFCDSIGQKIGVCTSNGSYCTIVIRDIRTNPSTMALDSLKGVMYWAEFGIMNGLIGKANMDGSNRDIIVSAHIKMPQALAIDVPNERLYWVDRMSQHIGSIRLDGSNRQRVMKIPSEQLQSLAVLEDRLYWTDYSKNIIQSCKKFDGGDITLLKDEQTRLRGMHIYHPLLKQNISNPCNTSGCTELCLLAGNNSYSCACSLDKKLSEDKHTCEVLSGQQYLKIVTKSIHFNYYGEFIGRPSIKRNEFSQHSNAFAYDPLNSSIFVNDVLTLTIHRYHEKTGKLKELHGIKNQQIGGMSFDHIGNNLYWTNLHRNTIEIYSLTTKQRTTLHFAMKPKNILLIPENSTMIVVFCNHSKCQLDKLSMDGSGPITTLVSTAFSGSGISLAYDYETQQVFWADQGFRVIERIFINGTYRQEVRLELEMPVSLAILKDRVYWTLRNDTKLYNIDKMSNMTLTAPYSVEFPLANKAETEHLIRIYNLNDTSKHECSINNGGCSHVCLVSSMDSHKCACPNGLILNSDGHTCEVRRECGHKEFECFDNSCIAHHKVCNGIGDCPDSEDEASCIAKHTNCSSTEFQCSSGECLPYSLICNGKYDCEDWSDEKNCNHWKCPVETDFKCIKSGFCISKSWQCDGQLDCQDGSDEESNCTVCPLDMDHCINEKCVHHSLLCDFINDCGDNTDEVQCAHYEHAGPKMDKYCSIDQFRCFGTDECIPRKSRCNGNHECPRHDDESHCSSCPEDHFVCNNLECIPRIRVCDNYNDCSDNSDEEFCDDNGKIHDDTNLPSRVQLSNTKLDDEKFICDNGHSLDFTYVCDGRANCADKSDEGGNCLTPCSIDSCEYHCNRTPKGPVCLCKSGYKLSVDNRTCEDVDECESQVCSQVCRNTLGSYQCDCIAGYSLRYDQRACKLIDSTMEVISSTTYDIRRIINHLRLVDVIQHINDNLTGMDADMHKNLLYWSDEQSGTITQYDLTSRNHSIVSHVGKPNLIALDWITKNIYFFNNVKPYSIMACSLLNNKCASIVKLEDFGTVLALAVDPIHGSIYWAQTVLSFKEAPKSQIYRSDMNGDNVKVIAHENIGIVTGITVDYNRSHLFWADTARGLIVRSGLDGTDRTIFRRVYQPMGIHIYEDSVYWMMSSTRNLYGCPLYGKIQCQLIPIEPSNIKNFIVISHKSRQPSVSNVCEKNNCEWMCVINDKTAACVCPDGSELNSNGTCSYNNNTTNPPVIDDNKSKHSANDDSNYLGYAYITAIGFGTFLIIAAVAACYHCRGIIAQKCRVMREASVSFHSTSFGHQRLSDASSPTIDDQDECVDAMVSSNIPTTSSQRSDTGLVDIHLSELHPLNARTNTDLVY